MKYRNLKHVEIYGIEPFGELETDEELPLAKGAIELVEEKQSRRKKNNTESE